MQTHMIISAIHNGQKNAVLELIHPERARIRINQYIHERGKAITKIQQISRENIPESYSRAMDDYVLDLNAQIRNATEALEQLPEETIQYFNPNASIKSNIERMEAYVRAQN